MPVECKKSPQDAANEMNRKLDGKNAWKHQQTLHQKYTRFLIRNIRKKTALDTAGSLMDHCLDVSKRKKHRVEDEINILVLKLPELSNSSPKKKKSKSKSKSKRVTREYMGV